MSFSQFLLILRARLWILLATLVVTVVAAIVLSLLLPKTYKATSSLLLNYKGLDPVTGLITSSQLLPGYTATQIDIIASKNVALRVVDALQLARSPAVIAQFNEATGGRGTVRDWLADLLLLKLEIIPARESSVVDVSFKGSDPQFAAAVANAFADEYQKLSVQLKADPMKKASSYFDAQTRLLRDNLEAAQGRLSKFQQEHGIVSVDNRLDVESLRLNDLSSQLVSAQAQALEAGSRRRMAQGGGGAESPDVAASPLIQSLKVNLASAESKLADLAQRLSVNHPQYQSVKAEADQLRSGLAEQTRVMSNSVGNNAQILQQREGAIRTALEAQRAKVLELNRTRDQMGVLSKDVESAQHAFDVVSQRLSQTRIEGQADQSDIALLNPAVAPLEHSSPKLALNIVMAIFLGSMIGVGLSLLVEMQNRSVRSERDLVDALQVPVLGRIDWRAPAPKRSRLVNIAPLRRLRAH